MAFLLSVRTASILSNRLHAVKCQRFTLVPLSTNRQYNNSCTSKSASILSATPAYQPIGQSIRKAHFIKGNKNWQISNAQNNKQYGESVYQGKYTNQMLRIKMLSFTTSVMGAIAQPILWQKGLEVSGAGLGIALCSIIGVFTFVTPVLLHLLVKKYVIDILHNKETDEYTAITISPFMLRNAITFKVDEVTVPETETMFTSVKVGPAQVPIFVDSASFTDIHHYERFMGYDKPFDITFDASVRMTEKKAADSSRLAEKKAAN